MLLERVIGNTVKGNGALAVNPVTGDFAYPAGCVLVFYSPRHNRQTQFFSCENNRPLTSVCISADGKYVCAAENGRQPAVLVWDVSNGKLLAKLKGHAFSVKCVRFSADSNMLASVGSQSDGRLHVWNWRAGMLLASARLKCEIRSLCFSGDGQMLVSAGSQGHLKYWELHAPSASGKCRVLKGKKAIMDGGPDTTGDFVDIAVSKCSKACRECYAITADGFLLSFDAERNLDKWVDVRSSAFSISVTDTHIACACAEGIVRLFNAPTLEYISTLPRPPPFRPAGTTLQTKDSDAAAGGTKRAASAPPHAIAVQMTTDNQRAGCIYSDRSFFVWDLRDVTKVCRCRAMHAHSGSIWDLDFLPSPAAQRAGLPPDSFVTCGSDSTIRIWGLAPRDGSKHETTAEGEEGSTRPVPFKDLRAMVVCSEWGVDAVEGNTGGGIRCIKVSPDGTRVASGDRMGNLRVHTLSNGMHMEMETFLEAHDAEILSIDYGGQDGNLLASAARDRLIHVFDVNRNYDTLCTLDEHAAAVTSVRFAARGTRLISCGGDKRMIFRTLLQPPDKCTQTHNAYLRVDASLTQNVPLGTVYDVCVDRAGRLALSAGQDNGLIVWEVATGTKKRRYTTDCECTLRVRLDPTGMFAATTSSDKAIRLHDFHSGDLVCIAHGHSEPVTAVAFAPSLDRLVSASGDGCIFVWQLPAAVANSMHSRQSELHSSCESILSVASILSTPREGCERVSGAGVFAVSPLKQNGKAAKPTISDLKKITLKSDGSNDDRTKTDELVARNAIASQRSMLSALLDETLDVSKKKDHASSVSASPPSDSAAVTNKQIDASSTNSTSAAPPVKKDNWMQSEEMQHKDAPAPAILSGGVGGGGGGGDVAKKRELRRVVEADLVVSEIEGHGVEQGQNVGSVIESSVAITADTAVSDADEDDKSGSELQEGDKVLDFTVLTSQGVRMSRALNASSLRPSNISGLGETLESDLDDDDADQSTVLEVDESATRRISAVELECAARGLDEESDDRFLREALSDKTVVVDARASLRASRSVGHLLQQQIRDVLSNSKQTMPSAQGAAVAAPAILSAASPALQLPQIRTPCDGSLLAIAAFAASASTHTETSASVDMTPRDTYDMTTESSVLSPGAMANRSNCAQQKNLALAREIDNMRQRLQAMGMCGGTHGDHAPTPALSAAVSLAPSVQASPAKPKPAARTYNNTQRQRETPPAFFLAGAGRDAAATPSGPRQDAGALPTPAAAPPPISVPPPTSAPAAAATVAVDKAAGVASAGACLADSSAVQQGQARQRSPPPISPPPTSPPPAAPAAPASDKMPAGSEGKAQQQRVECSSSSKKGASSSAVYQALEGDEVPSLAEERRRLKEKEAAKRAQEQESAEDWRAAEEQAQAQACKEQPRDGMPPPAELRVEHSGAKYETEFISARLKELDHRKCASLATSRGVTITEAAAHSLTEAAAYAAADSTQPVATELRDFENCKTHKIGEKKHGAKHDKCDTETLAKTSASSARPPCTADSKEPPLLPHAESSTLSEGERDAKSGEETDKQNCKTVKACSASLSVSSVGVSCPPQGGGGVVEFNLRLDMDFQAAGQEGSMQRQVFVKDLKQDLAHASGMGTLDFNILKLSPGSVVAYMNAPETAAQEIQRQSLDPNSRLRSGKVTRFTDKVTLPIISVSVSVDTSAMAPKKYPLLRKDENTLHNINASSSSSNINENNAHDYFGLNSSSQSSLAHSLTQQQGQRRDVRESEDKSAESDMRAQHINEVLKRAATKKDEVQQARRKAEQVERALREALQQLQDSHGSIEQRNTADAASAEEVQRLEAELQTARDAADAAEGRAQAAQQRVADVQQTVESLRAGEVQLLLRAHREAEARMTAEATAAAALERLQQLQNDDRSITLSGPVSQSLPRGIPAMGASSSAMGDASASLLVRPRTAPPAPLETPMETLDLVEGVMQFALEMGHTVVSPVMSSVKTCDVLTGSAAGVHQDPSVDPCSLLEKEVEIVEKEECLGKQSSQHVMGASGPEVFDIPSAAGDMEDESVSRAISARSSSSSTLSTDSNPASTIHIDLEKPQQQEHYPEAVCQQGEKEGVDERSLSCIQNRMLPLQGDASVGMHADSSVGEKMASMQDQDGTIDNKESHDTSSTRLLTPQTSIADTVHHQSRPSTAPAHSQACAHTNSRTSRPATPCIAQRGWVGGRDGGATSELVMAGLDQATVEIPATPAEREEDLILDSAGPGHGVVRDSPSAGWHITSSSLRPARQADPNHPLRVGLARLDETAGSVSQSVYCSTLDDTQCTATTFGTHATALPAVEAGERLRSSVNMALDLFNVARASGQRAAVADIVSALRASQDRIAEALRGYDLDLNGVPQAQNPWIANAPDGRRGEGAGVARGPTGNQHDDPPSAVYMPLRVLPATATSAASNLSTNSSTEPMAATVTPDKASLGNSAIHVAVPVLPLPARTSVGVQGGWWSQADTAASQSVYSSTALPSARSSIECTGSNSHRCNFENLSEISINSEGRIVVDVEEVLERYSERLLQMVSAKIKNSSSASVVPPAGGEVQ